MKINAQEAAATDRAYDDQHDSTVRVQNALAVEMSLGEAGRGLAGGGTHRGESLRVFTVGPFAANSASIATLAADIFAAVDYLNGEPELLYYIVGFRVGGETTGTISATRAANVRAAVVAGVTASTTSVETSPAGNETLTRAQPATDGGLGSSAIVEIRMAIRPACLITPIGVAPPSPPVHVDPANPARVAALKRGNVNECHHLLANTAWP